MDETPTTIELVLSPWEDTYYQLIESAQDELLISSPFLTSGPLQQTAALIQRKHSFKAIHVITNLAVDSILTGSLDIAALLDFAQTVPATQITYLPRLHAKAYIADSKAAIITSANLTGGGLVNNREYGILVRDPQIVSQIRCDLDSYASLGNTVSLDTLLSLTQAAQDLKSTRQRIEKTTNTKLRQAFERKVDAAKTELLKTRANGKTTHGIFSDTIRYLLEKHGPLATTDLHPLMQQIHPDLCDDAIDRVIGGVHFGKKWKHYVRNAQQALKKQRLIEFDGRHWYLVK